MNLRILFVEDNEEWRSNLVKFFEGEEILGHRLETSSAGTFEEGKRILATEEYDLVVLDLYEGEPKDGNPKTGLEILGEIQNTTFVPVIFFTGLTKDVEDLSSEIVGIVNKSGGLGALKSQLENTISSKLALLKQQISTHVKESLRKFFWETVHSQNKIFEPGKIDISLGYLILRRLANSLSKENIKAILGDDKIQIDKIHPMEFYVFPPASQEFEAGEILKSEKGELSVLLTPSCDFVEREKKGLKSRKVGKVLLARALPLSTFTQFSEYQNNKSVDNKNKLLNLIRNNATDRYFFLPKTPFIGDNVVDFQDKFMVEYERLADFKRLAKLDSPIAESLISSFLRYYNRIGFPDIDADFVLAHL